MVQAFIFGSSSHDIHEMANMALSLLQVIGHRCTIFDLDYIESDQYGMDTIITIQLNNGIKLTGTHLYWFYSLDHVIDGKLSHYKRVMDGDELEKMQHIYSIYFTKPMTKWKIIYNT